MRVIRLACWVGAALLVACDDGAATGVDTGDTAETSDTSPPPDTDDTTDTLDTDDTLDTTDTSDTADTSDTSDTSDSTDTTDTSDTVEDTTPDTPDVVEVPLILINEVAAVGDPADWVELFNADTVTVDLSGWRLRDDDPTHEALLPEGTSIAPGTYLVLDRDSGAWGFGLGSTDAVVLTMADGSLVDAVAWIDGDSPAGATWARLPDAGATWATSWEPTPGAANVPGTPPVVDCGDGVVDPLTELCDGVEVNGLECLRWGFAGGSLACAAGCQSYDFSGCTPRTGLVINEATSAGDDLVELYNGTSATLDLTGYRLVDDGDNGYTFPAAQLEPGAYRVLRKGTDHTFGIGGGDALWLYAANGDLVDHVDWDEGEALVSFCRIPNATGRFSSCSTATFGATNLQ